MAKPLILQALTELTGGVNFQAIKPSQAIENNCISIGGQRPLHLGVRPGVGFAGWGGARNSSHRRSWCLSEAQCRRAIAAASKAIDIGLPLNRFLTVHIERVGIPDAEAMAVVTRLLKCYRDTFPRQAAAFWVRENTPGKGSHVHILFHAPEGLRLGRRTRTWAELATRKPYVAGVVRTRTLPHGVAYASNLAGTVGYMLKGASPEVVAALKLPRCKQGGWITGKRCGGARNIWGRV